MLWGDDRAGVIGVAGYEDLCGKPSPGRRDPKFRVARFADHFFARESGGDIKFRAAGARKQNPFFARGGRGRLGVILFHRFVGGKAQRRIAV